MRTSRPGRLGAVFVVVTVLVVAGLTAGSLLTQAPPTAETVDGYENLTAVEPERPIAGGAIDVERGHGPKTILIDAAHANRFEADDIRPFTRALTGAGYRIRFLESRDRLPAALSAADAFVVVDPGTAFDRREARAVSAFAASGGRVALFGEPTRRQLQQGGLGTAVFEVPSRIESVAAPLGVEFGTEYLYNLGENEGNFKRVYASGRDEAFGPERVALYTATTVGATGGEPLVRTRGDTHSSGADTAARHTVATRRGNVLAVGDSTFLGAGTYAVADNEDFIASVATFLVSGNRTGSLAAVPATLPPEPSVTYTNANFLEPTQGLAEELRDAGARPTLSFRGASPGATDVLLVHHDYLARTDVGVGIDVGDHFVSVGDATASRAWTSVIATDHRGYDLVVATPDMDGAEQVVGVLAQGNLTRYAIDDGVAFLPTNVSVG